MTSYSFDEEGVAFYFFIATLTACYIIPATMKLLWPKKVSDNDKEPLSLAKESKDKQARISAALKAKSKASLPRKLILGALWAVFLWAAVSAWRAKINYKIYDPFEILGISTVKSSFKKLSRMYHPDKAAPEKREEHQKKFLDISKAYKALTDPVSRKNWEEYGNPDGVRTFSLGVALPTWLVNSSNRVILLVLYCVAFGVGLPLIVKRWWSSSKDFTKDGIRHTSMAIFFREMKENYGLKRIVEMLANAAEFNVDLPMRPTDEKAIKSLISQLENHTNPQGNNFEPLRKGSNLATIKAHALLYCHFNRIPIENADLRTDQVYIINKSAQLVQGILQIALARQWLLPTLTCMHLSQALVQAVWDRSSPLLQLPHINNEIVRHATMGKKAVRNISELIDMPETERRTLLRALNDEEYREVLSIAQTFPVVNVNSVTFRILGQENITPGGLITCQVMLSLEYPFVGNPEGAVEEAGKEKMVEEEVETFEFDEDGNLIDDPANKRFGATDLPKPIYSPHFGTIKRPNWWVGLINRNNTNLIAQPVKVTDLVDRKTVTLQLPAPPRPLNVTVRLFVKSDSMIGADVEKEVSFTVHPSSEESPASEKWEISGDEEDQAVPFSGMEDGETDDDD